MEVLSEEHRVIERVLDQTERMLNEFRLDADFMGKALDFFRNFADECHHAKEENVFFPVLEAAGIPREAGPIGCMLAEHEQGRSLVRAMTGHLEPAARGDPYATDLLRASAREFITLLRGHIYKEDNVLFIVADHALDAEKQAWVCAQFRRADLKGCDQDKHERYLALADELSNWDFAVAVPRE